MNKDLVQINPSEFGLTDETALNIKQQFQPMLDKMVELESEFNMVIALPIDEPSTTKKAKELRLKYVKIRTGTAEIHKAQKSFYLNGGRFVDGWKNAQIFASQGKEEALEAIEKHFENLEKERKQKLHSERVELIRPFVEDTTAYSFGDMQEDVFYALLAAKRQAYNDKIEAEKKAEEERIAREKAEAEEREAQRLENIRLRQEAEAREREIAIERAKAEEERKAAELVAQKQRKELEAKAKAEAEAREMVEAKLKAKKEEEERIEAARLAEEAKAKKEAEKLAKAPIQKQLTSWVDSFYIPESPSHATAEIIKAKFEAFKVWAKIEITKI